VNISHKRIWLTLEKILETLRKSEQIAYQLRSIFEHYGYQKFRMAKFEAYDFYTHYKDFLADSPILTFTDFSGKLMALKPDVTMSIVKNTRATEKCPEKLYYMESVYRLSREVREFKEIFQIGLEYIGKVSAYTQVEVINLALKCLACIDENYVLGVSHMGFLSGFFDAIPVDQTEKRTLLDCLESKNLHELNRLIGQYHLDDQLGKQLKVLAGIGGSMETELQKINGLILNEKMQIAYEDLQSLYDVLKRNQLSRSMRMDFSLTTDEKYYNGLVFRGYVMSVPKAILSGGQYDNLLIRMHKPDLQAIGFAIYFDEMERVLKQPENNSYDMVILYDDNSDLSVLYEEVEDLICNGKRVYVGETIPQKIIGTVYCKMERNRRVEIQI
jgi:ATP phosphoribosyltransferase regulatory subunit